MMLRAEKIAKDYATFSSFGERLLASFTLGLRGPSRKFRALDGITFEAGSESSGEILGIIGPNGAGKSTLLRILSGISPATSGSVKFGGSVRSILELGVGFSPELTALENVYYNGRLWGYGGRQLLERAEEIFSFAGLEDYVSAQLKTFSTGMQMRLGFALATFERSDLLLVDEALAVGDASFQQKCIQRFLDYRGSGSVVIVVSHDINLLQSVCDRMLLLDRGNIVAAGNSQEVSEKYMHLIAERSFDETLISGGGSVSSGLELLDEAGRSRRLFFSGEKALFRVTARTDRDLSGMTFGLHISDSRGIRAFGTNTNILNLPGVDFKKGESRTAEFQVRMNLGPGLYSAGFSLHRGRSHGSDCHVWEESVLDFEVETKSGEGFIGMSYLEPSVKVTETGK